MTSYTLPDTLRYYFGFDDDLMPIEIASRQSAIRQLVSAFAGKAPNKKNRTALEIPANPSKLDWDAMKLYNTALGAAAQTRADYIGLLFQIWDRTFGDSGARELGENSLHPTYFTIHSMWSHSFVGMDVNINDPDGSKVRSYSLIVEKLDDNDHFSLSVRRWKNDDKQLSVEDGFFSEHWQVGKDPDNSACTFAFMRNAVRISSLGKDFTAALGNAPAAASEIVELLRKSVL